MMLAFHVSWRHKAQMPLTDHFLRDLYLHYRGSQVLGVMSLSARRTG